MNKITRLIIKNYHKFPIDCESQLPVNTLKMLFDECNSNKSKWNDSLEKMNQFIDGITKLDCFTYRAVNQVEDELVYWNSLQQHFDDFKKADTVIYQTDTPYPTADMIIAWCKRQAL
jgi:hypothetical protein